MTFTNAYGETLTEYIQRRAAMIHRKLQTGVNLQVRWDPVGRWGQPALLTYIYPRPKRRGHEEQGEFVGAYTSAAKLEWIEEDLLTFAYAVGATTPSETA